FVIGLPTMMNLGLFALAGCVSWTLFPSPRIDWPAKGSSGRLSRAGGTIRDVSSSAIQCISGAKDEHVVRVENTYGTQALSRAWEQATDVDLREKVRQQSPAKQIFAIVMIAFGYLIEACFGCFFLFLYEYARIHGPDVQGMKRLSLTLGKLLDLRDGL